MNHHQYAQYALVLPMVSYVSSKMPLNLSFEGDEGNPIRTIVSDPNMRVDAFCQNSVEKEYLWLYSVIQKDESYVSKMPLNLSFEGDEGKL